jgi:hypothetical protein
MQYWQSQLSGLQSSPLELPTAKVLSLPEMHNDLFHSNKLRSEQLEVPQMV